MDVYGWLHKVCSDIGGKRGLMYLFILFIDNLPHNKIQNDYKRGQ